MSLRSLSRFVALGILVATACNTRGGPVPDSPHPLATLALPTVSAAGIGEQFDPALLAGKVVIVNFWKPS